METISELKKICIKKHKKGVSKPHWWSTLFARRVSIYITWLAVQTRITANQVTLAQLIVSIIGVCFLSFADIRFALLGSLLLHLGYILDNVDGEVARYKRSQSVNGMFLDFVNHLVIIPLTFFCFGLHYYFLSDYNLIYLIGAVVAFVSLNHYIFRGVLATIHYLVLKGKSPSYSIENLQFDKTSNRHKKTDQERNRGGLYLFKLARKIVRELYDYPGDVIIISILITFEFFTGNSTIGRMFVIIFAVYQILDQALDLHIYLKNKVVQRDFRHFVDNAAAIAKQESD